MRTGTRRFLPLRRLWPVVLLFAGCRAVLGIEEPIEVDETSGSDGGAAGQEANGAAGGSMGSGGSAVGAGGSMGSGGSAGATGGGVLGDPCDDEGAVQCAGPAQGQRLECMDGNLRPTDPCEEGTLCDRGSGECENVVEGCVGRKPGEGFCSGRTWTKCGPDLVSVETETCDTVQSCRPAGCAACLANEFSCDNDRLLKCKDDLSGFELFDTCGATEPCNPDAGACTSLACLPDQRRCNGDVLERCNEDQSAFEVVQECGEGLCDRVNFECDVCVPASAACADERTLETCDEDGQALDQAACPASGFCIDPGVCVECRDVGDCPDPGECKMPACSSGTKTCNPSSVAPRTPCSGGVCDAAGACVECINASDCDNSNECIDVACLANGTCDPSPVDRGDPCSGGVCDGAGACVECVSHDMCNVPMEKCEDDECVPNPTYTIGNPGPTAFSGDANAVANVVYAFELPPIANDVDVIALGLVGRASGTNARLAIYRDDSGGPGPLVVSTNVLAVLTTPNTEVPLPQTQAKLFAGTTYWIAVTFQTAPSMGSQASSGAVGFRQTNAQAAWPMIPDPFQANATLNGVAWNLYATVRDIVQ